MIIPETYVRTDIRDGSAYSLRCIEARCIDCARQLGLLRECPVCGKVPHNSGRICEHSRACVDYGTGGYYINGVEVPRHLSVEHMRWFGEDDVV